jgi:adenylate cyclase
MSGDPGLQYFADGTTENLIANLARSPQIRVIARTSTDAYKNKSVDIRQIGKELGVRYILEGSVQKNADKVRIVAQLIDARNGDHVWTDRFDRRGSDPLALQDEVTGKIVQALAGDAGLIKKKQYEDAWGKDTAQLDEWDYYLRGHEEFLRFAKEDMDKAAEIWEEGLKKFPDSPLLKIKLGWAYYERWFQGWGADPQRDIETAFRYAQEVMGTNRAPPLATALGHWLLGYLYGDYKGDYERAVMEERTAIKLMPTELSPKADLAYYLAVSGKPDEAISSLDWLGSEALNDQFGSHGYYWLGLAHFIKGNYPKAIESFRELLSIDPGTGLPILAASYAQAGQMDKAKATVKRIVDANPTFTIELFRRSNNIPDKEALGRLLDGLRRAGLPES